MATLPGTTNQAALQLILAHLNNIDVVKPQDFGNWYGGLLHNPAAQQAAWDWARAHWDWLDDKLNGSMNYTNLAKIPANYFQTPQRLADFKAFFRPKLNQANLPR